MSTENLDAFRTRVAADPALQQKVADIHMAAARVTAEQLAALSVEIGTPFTVEELLAPRELTEAELDQVAGGIHGEAWEVPPDSAFGKAVAASGSPQVVAADREMLAALLRSNLFTSGFRLPPR